MNEVNETIENEANTNILSGAESHCKFEERFITETGFEATLTTIIEPVLQDLGFVLIRIKLINTSKGQALQIMIERQDGTITIEDCEEISKVLSPTLDAEDPIQTEYDLEISSPGLDRPLVRRSDFIRWKGHEIKIKLLELIEGKKRYRGLISDSTQTHLLLKTKDQVEPVKLPIDELEEVRLIITDRLIQKALRDEKKARKESKIQRKDLDNKKLK